VIAAASPAAATRKNRSVHGPITTPVFSSMAPMMVATTTAVDSDQVSAG
jgi:hypothetical protein